MNTFGALERNVILHYGFILNWHYLDSNSNINYTLFCLRSSIGFNTRRVHMVLFLKVKWFINLRRALFLYILNWIESYLIG